MPFGKSLLPIADTFTPSAAPKASDISKKADDCKISKELSPVSESSSLSEVSRPSQYSDEEVMTTTSTVSPNPKKIRCGTNSDCMDEDTDASNALTVEWAKPFIGEVQDWRGTTIKRS